MYICHFFCTFAPEMRINNLNSALLELTNRYEQVCIVGDAAVRRTIPDIPSLWLETSEQTKTLETVQRIWDFLFEQRFTRHGLLVCIGGGVLTDLGGFAAATYKRGIDYINVPTTLLAMIDASTGGKTGCNYHGLKNSIGVFHTPVDTYICADWLKTLPAHAFLSGYAEMLKHAILSDEIEWNRLLQYNLDKMDTEAILPFIERSIAFKQRIVDADSQEKGLRKILNFGHTFGHALEEIQMDYGTLPHGYAVLYGMIAELYLSVTMLDCPKEPLQQLTQLMLHYYGRPVCNCKDRERLIGLMQQDKKNEHAAEINCTLLKGVNNINGKRTFTPVINQTVTPAQAEEALDYLFSL